MASILVVDDEMGIRELLNEILTDEGHTVYAAESAIQARTIREQMRPDLVLLDIWMPDTDGITLLKEWSKTGQLTMPVVMMSGHPKPVANEAAPAPLEGEFISGIAKTYFDLPLREARDLFEKAYFEHQMQIMGGSMTKISEYTGLERTHLYRKLKALGIDTSRNKGEQ